MRNLTPYRRYTLFFALLCMVSAPVSAAPLHEAVKSGDSAQVLALITPDTDVDERDASGLAAIHYAVLESRPKLLEMLIGKGADVNIAIKSSRTADRFYTHLHSYAPLHIAANFHYTAAGSNALDMARLLVSRGADVNRKTDASESPLHLAVRSGNDRLVALLIANGADVDARDFEDYTPLHNAAWNGHLRVVELLVSSGADTGASAYDGRTPYYCAVRRNRQDVIAYFEKLGVVE